MTSIRNAELSDVALLHSLIREMAEYERLRISTTEESLSHEGFGQQRAFRALIAEHDGEAAGYALFFNCYSTFQGRGLFLEDLFVRSRFRNKGVGDTLLSQVASIALEEGCFGVMMNVLAWNLPAIEFFEQRHAKFMDDWKTACLDGDALRYLAAAK
jgi:GNAT superfamily N-acetyltransferase